MTGFNGHIVFIVTPIINTRIRYNYVVVCQLFCWPTIYRKFIKIAIIALIGSNFWSIRTAYTTAI